MKRDLDLEKFLAVAPVLTELRAMHELQFSGQVLPQGVIAALAP